MRRFIFSHKFIISILVIVGVLVGVGITIQHAQHMRPAAPSLPSPPLKDLASKQGIELGNFAIASHLKDPAYSGILTSQFNLALIDNTPNWSFTNGGIHPGKNTYNFKEMDYVVHYAETHHMRMQAHHFVWGDEKWLPTWLTHGNYSPDQLLQIMHDHITTVGSRYKGQIQEWTVVNEAFTRQQHLYGLHDWWADHTGSMDYIDSAFRWAHEADPHAVLILNDFNNETENATSDAMYNYIRGAKARGVPIDAIGMQMHIDGTHPPKKDDVIANMKRFKAIGVDVYITELDVNMNDLPADNKTKDSVEANIYYDMTRACIESGACKSLSILGITDAETWYSYMGVKDSRPLPFDALYQPKPAFYSLRNALQ